MQNGLVELTHQQAQAQHPLACTMWPSDEAGPPVRWHLDASGTLHAESSDGWPFVWDAASGEWDAM